MSARTITLYVTIDSEMSDAEVADLCFDVLESELGNKLKGISLPSEEGDA